MEPLHCCVKRYDWGSVDGSSIASRFARGEPPPHAEAWIGTHAAGPSTLARSGEPLCAPLSFMLKFLSVGRALSIQLHPDAANARRLHARDPCAYPDAFAKPEMAIALTPARALVGFRYDWRDALAAHPEIPRFETLREFARYAASDPRALEAFDTVSERESPGGLLRELAAQRPGDATALLSLAMNLVELSSREAVAIRPGVVHAYLSGEFAECMACSDNVIRLGLTSKPIDVEAALECADFEPAPPRVIREPEDGVYESGFSEFEVARVEDASFRSGCDALVGVSSGEGVVECDGETHEARAGSAFHARPGALARVSSGVEAWVATRAGALETRKNLRT